MTWRTIASVLNRPLAIRSSPIDKRDAIVVLGASLGANDTLTPVLAERVAAAAKLFDQGAAPIVITTGGVTGGQRAEAAVIADALVIAGVPREHILVEDRSQTTAENAHNVAALTTARRVWLVTQPFHARRAERLFRVAGFDARAWHIADSVQYRDHRRAVRWLVREYAAWVKTLMR